jgi:DNA polymerase III subunit gamma/tau
VLKCLPQGSALATYSAMSDALFDLPETPSPNAPAYRVLARKYRPQNFAELKGQEALVRTLTNAFASGRIAHAFILTGVRGVGKTTTARIIAKGLNCESGPTITPCGKCTACISIAEGRNMDVIEMNAADNRKIDDVRKIIESAKYAPTSVRTKIYILDEVHMFVDEAFNALLKILEEPPPHVKFILATTEIRKVPVTILSRCQRFDLRRIEPDVLNAHFAEVAKAEGVEIEAEALALLARAADGSARDGLSLMDQAIARGAPVTAASVRDMLGLADRSQVLELLNAALKGDAAGALKLLAHLHQHSAEPLTVLQDLLDSTHQLSRLKILPANSNIGVTETELKILRELADSFTTPVLARAWQVLLRGVPEVQSAPQPLAALEMLLIRLAHIGTLPPPGDLVKKLERALQDGIPAGASAQTTAPQGAPVMRMAVGQSRTVVQSMAQAQPLPQPNDWKTLVALVAQKRELTLYGQLTSFVECQNFAPGALTLFLRPGISPNAVSRLTGLLQEWTGARWLIDLAKQSGALTIAEEEAAQENNKLQQAAEHPLVKAVLLAFPGAKIAAVREKVIPGVETPDVAVTELSPELSIFDEE